jgi:hypothetical protein
MSYSFMDKYRNRGPAITDPQRRVLQELLPADQLHLLATMTRDEASARISELSMYWRRLAATPAQVRYLKWKGMWNNKRWLRRGEASDIIGALKAQEARVDAEREAAEERREAERRWATD